ncbi:hypothetical protein [Massilia sp. S19_KUP03_FR1]|uniref:hypothetical protein n=1 Tax=Massilia sp. S19_KUP03_FR1 TaxID=3025503 RepID=UPI002FCCCA0B
MTQGPARHLALLAGITAASVPVMMLLYHWLGFDAAALAVLGFGTAMVAAPLLLRAGASLELASNVFLSGLFGLKVWLACHLGGLGAVSTAWFVLCPLVAALLGGARPAVVWAALVFKAYAVLFLWSRFVGPLVPHPVRDAEALALAGQLGLLVLVTVVALCFREDTR